LKQIIFAAFAILLLPACEEVVGNTVDVVRGPQAQNQKADIYVLSDDIFELENMEKKTNGAKPVTCSGFKSRVSLFEFSLYGLKHSTDNLFTNIVGDKLKIRDLQSSKAARIQFGSFFEFLDPVLQRSLNPFNRNLQATFTDRLLVINLENVTGRGGTGSRPGTIVYEKVTLEEFEELNKELTFYCR